MMSLNFVDPGIIFLPARMACLSSATFILKLTASSTMLLTFLEETPTFFIEDLKLSIDFLGKPSK